MQASVTTVFRSARDASSIPNRSASPARAWRTTATFSARAGRDSCSPERSVVEGFNVAACALEQTLASGEGSVLIDLTQCEFIDSTGIALIVRAWQRLDSGANGRALVICSHTEQVRRVLEITGLELSIPVHETRDEALAAIA